MEDQLFCYSFRFCWILIEKKKHARNYRFIRYEFYCVVKIGEQLSFCQEIANKMFFFCFMCLSHTTSLIHLYLYIEFYSHILYASIQNGGANAKMNNQNEKPKKTYMTCKLHRRLYCSNFNWLRSKLNKKIIKIPFKKLSLLWFLFLCMASFFKWNWNQIKSIWWKNQVY